MSLRGLPASYTAYHHGFLTIMSWCILLVTLPSQRQVSQIGDSGSKHEIQRHLSQQESLTQLGVLYVALYCRVASIISSVPVL